MIVIMDGGWKVFDKCTEANDSGVGQRDKTMSVGFQGMAAGADEQSHVKSAPVVGHLLQQEMVNIVPGW